MTTLDLILCKKCGIGISDQARFCPHCGAKTGTGAPSGGRRVLFVAGASAIVVASIYLAAGGGSPQQELSITPDLLSEIAAKARRLQPVDVSITEEKTAKYVTGSITNTSGQKFSRLSVRIILYDSSGERVGGAGDFIQDFEPDQTWKFQALILGDAPVASARVSEIEGW
jgi:hypothetical protein